MDKTMNSAQRLQIPYFEFPTDIFTLYLSHPSKSRKEIRDWEIGFEGRHPNIALINPFYDISGEGRADIKARDEGRDFPKDAGYNWRLVKRDIMAIAYSRGMVAFIDENFDVSAGTPMEFVYGRMLACNPKFCICKEPRLFNHPWVQTHFHKVYRNEDKFEAEIEEKIKHVQEKWGF